MEVHVYIKCLVAVVYINLLRYVLHTGVWEISTVDSVFGLPMSSVEDMVTKIKLARVIRTS